MRPDPVSNSDVGLVQPIQHPLQVRDDPFAPDHIRLLAGVQAAVVWRNPLHEFIQGFLSCLQHRCKVIAHRPEVLE